MALRIGINGFGRIGRQVVRAAIDRGAPLEFVAVNDITDADTLAHLLRYDSVQGAWAEAAARATDGKLRVGDRSIQVLSEKEPAKLPWRSLGVQAVLEATGKFTDRAGGALHLDAGARNVLISAPAKGADLTFVFGVNDAAFDPRRHPVVSIGSCTTNCLAPVAKVLHDSFEIEHGFMTTIHAYTNDQQILDLPHKDPRRARAAAVNIIPTSTGAAKATGLVLPHLQGKLDGIAMRVPVPDGSVTDLVATLQREATIEEINEAFRKAAASGDLEGKLVYTEDPIVSSDIVGSPASCTFDAESTMVMGNVAKIIGWYDNEWGYSNRCVDLLMYMARKGM